VHNSYDFCFQTSN